MTDKSLLKKRFKEAFPQYRLLAIHLNGFSHSLIYDEGTKESAIQSMEWSAYVPSGEKLASIFNGFSHYAYKGMPEEILYIHPDKR